MLGVRGLLIRFDAKKYAAALGPQLLKGWGASEFYTPHQIRAAASKGKLPARYLRIGYAEFLRLPDFLSVVAGATAKDYEALRALYARYLPSSALDSFAPLTIEATSVWPADLPPGPHG